MLKLARWSTTHRKYVLLGWVVALFGINFLAQSAGTSYSNNFTLPNSDAQRASDLLQRSFPAQAGDRDTIVYKVNSGPIESFIPVMLFAIVFGLSMDYEVFLVSRIHERWTHTRENSRAVAEGLALTGRVVTAAAAIMVCVFLSFMLGEDRVIKEFGLSLASAVLLDALVIRCLLLPAVLHLIGRRTWSLPGRLDRILPRLNVEGTVLPAQAAAAGASPNGEPPSGAPGRYRTPAPATGGAEG
jgi:uncharacterized membrane protein YdfJ with MMPL/SSD domain